MALIIDACFIDSNATSRPLSQICQGYEGPHEAYTIDLASTSPFVTVHN